MNDYNLKSIKQQFKNQGVFYTSKELAQTLKDYVDVEIDEVYDPTCGNGNLLSVFDDSIKKYGQEINEEQLKVAKNRLVNFQGICGDTLKSPAFLEKKFKCIVANYPFSIKWEPKVDERFLNAPTIPTAGKADFAFLLHIIYFLKNNGVAITLNFPGVLYRAGKEGELRKWLVNQNYIERIVQVPQKSFVDTPISTIIIIFKKNKKTTDIIFEDKELKEKRVVKLEEIKKNDFILSVSTYIFLEKKVIKLNPLELQKNARNQMLQHLRKDIIFDRQVCELEKWDTKAYINEIKALIKEL